MERNELEINLVADVNCAGGENLGAQASAMEQAFDYWFAGQLL